MIGFKGSSFEVTLKISYFASASISHVYSEYLSFSVIDLKTLTDLYPMGYVILNLSDLIFESK